MKNYLITLAALSLTLMSCNNQKQAETITASPNPFITHMYTADPSAPMYGKTDVCMFMLLMMLILRVGAIVFLNRYHVFSTDDMVNWTDHGEH